MLRCSAFPLGGIIVLLRVAFSILWLVLAPSMAHAQKRVALIIGNSAYKHTGELANPKNDAADMSAALKKYDFEVLEGFDLNKAAFDRKVRDFAAALQDAAAGVFFYAGHGLQVRGINYLVPVDAELTTSAALDFEMVRLDVVHRVMEQQTNSNVLFLDACRDNPLARNLARALGARSAEIGRGLAAVESGSGTLISFSTQPGNTAFDGRGRNSPYAAALVRNITTSKDDLNAILVSVRNDVMKETQGKQVPWEHSALTSRFYFSPPTPQAANISPTFEQQIEISFWESVKASKNTDVLQTYLDRFPNGQFASLAQVMIAHLRQEAQQLRALTARETELRAAEEAKRQAEQKREEAERKAIAARQTEELRKAQQEARLAREALKEAERQREAAEEAMREARVAAAAAQAVREADVKAEQSKTNATVEVRASADPRSAVNKGEEEQRANRLKRRGKQLLAEGDITAARSFFSAAAEAGDAEAALAMGGTYDPHFWEHGVRGMKPDVATANFWYRRALDLGSKDALDRIDQLGKR
jgi:uncharacterized caspase-like protein